MTAPDSTVGRADTDATTDTDDGREARRYRQALRAAEGQRDGLAARLAAVQRAEAERLAGAVLATPSSMWTAGVELDGLLDQDGQLDPAAVAAAATGAADQLGLAAPRQPMKPDMSMGARGGSGMSAADSWAAFLRTH